MQVHAVRSSERWTAAAGGWHAAAMRVHVHASSCVLLAIVAAAGWSACRGEPEATPSGSTASRAPSSTEPHAPSAQAADASAAVPPVAIVQATTLPPSVDLRPQLTELGFVPRAQGARGTCSIFTTCAALEFALERATGEARRMSPEFLNWSASQAAGAPSDGNFFHNALNGFARFGICAESTLPYRASFDAAFAPPQEALDEARVLREATSKALAVHWIVPWQSARFGVDETQLREIQAVLARGYPVAAGSGHSRLLVGYRDDASLAGGGAFLTEDSALARFDEVSYAFVREQVADVFWIEALETK